MNSDIVISRLGDARQKLAEAKSAQVIKGIIDVAETARIYAKRTKLGIDIINDCTALRVYAEHKLGGLLKVMPKNDGTLLRGSKQEPRDNTPTLSELGIDKKLSFRSQAIAELSIETIDSQIKAASEKLFEITVSQFFEEARALQKRSDKEEIADNLRQKPLPDPAGTFDVIVVDPPWKYNYRPEDDTHRARLQYPGMTVEEIVKLPVLANANKNCILWLWATNAFLRDAFGLLDSWKFEHKTILTWAKDKMGLGDWLRGQTEHCLFAIRGRPVVVLTNQTTLLFGPLREHSRKPDEFFTMVEALCPGTKLEYFQRQPRPGWQGWGAETTKFKGARNGT
jgi:N6-adenosine-specific RNA methylase IME4